MRLRAKVEVYGTRYILSLGVKGVGTLQASFLIPDAPQARIPFRARAAHKIRTMRRVLRIAAIESRRPV